MLAGSLMTWLSFGVKIHIDGPTLRVTLPGSLAGAVKRISVSSRPRRRLGGSCAQERRQDEAR
jgi:hypothetical protein